MKGYNAKQVGNILFAKWRAFMVPCAIMLDASRFDEHCSVCALKWEHLVYMTLYKGSRKLKHLLKQQLSNRGIGVTSDGVLFYRVSGRRMSGDMNTAMGNCLIMCALVYAYASHCGVVIQLGNNGDDCVVFLEAGDVGHFLVGLNDWFLEMGYAMKQSKPVYEFEKVDFCQTSPVYTPEGYIMVRNPHIAIAKDCYSIQPMDTPSSMSKYLKVLGAGGMSLTGGIPIWQEFYNLLESVPSVTSDRKENKVFIEGAIYMMSRGLDRSYCTIDPRTRFSFWRAFDISPDAQVAVEEHYRNTDIEWKSSPSFVHESEGDHFFSAWPVPSLA
jgi:hypothetical protein